MKDYKSSKRHETALVLAGGGVAGLGEISGTLRAIEDYIAPNPDVYKVPILGTSAGSIAGGFAVTGVRFEHVENIEQFSWPECLRPGFIEETLDQIYRNADINVDEIKADNVEAIVFRAMSLKPWRRPGLHKINGGEVRLPKLGAASSAVPGVFSPVKIGSDFYVDGGVGLSASHITLAPESDNTIVVAPMAEHFMPPVGGVLERMIINEIDARQRKYGGNAVYLRPNRKVGKIVKNVVDVFSVKKGKQIYDESYLQTFNILEKYVGDERKVSLADVAIRLAERPEFTTPTYYDRIRKRVA